MIQLPRAKRLLLILAPSTILCPLFSVLAALSDPARSISYNLEYRTTCEVEDIETSENNSNECDLDEKVLAKVGAIVLRWLPCRINYNKSYKDVT